jgi:SM-20-related protein
LPAFRLYHSFGGGLWQDELPLRVAVMLCNGKKMSAPARQITKKTVSGRDIFVCDNFTDQQTGTRITQLLRTFPYRRQEVSRHNVPASGASVDIAAELLESDEFFRALRAFGEEMFPTEKFTVERCYVNNSVYGDMYYAHRDCHSHLSNITVLYYGNMRWEADWGGETVFYNDDMDAEFAVSPRPCRALVSRGAIVHRGGVPSRICHQERFTIAYKLAAV